MNLDYVAMPMIGIGMGCLILWVSIQFHEVDEDGNEEVWDVDLKLTERQYQFLRTLVIGESKTEFFQEFDSFRKPHSLKPIHEDLEDYVAMLQVGLLMGVISERQYWELEKSAKERAGIK